MGLFESTTPSTRVETSPARVIQAGKAARPLAVLGGTGGRYAEDRVVQLSITPALTPEIELDAKTMLDAGFVLLNADSYTRQRHA